MARQGSSNRLLSVLCERCGADMAGEPSRALRCAPCRDILDPIYRQRRKREENYRVAVRRGTCTLSWEQWMRSKCKLAHWVDSAWQPVKLIRRLSAKKVEPEVARARKAKSYRNRYRNDPEYNIRQRMKASMRKHRRFGCINTRCRAAMNGYARGRTQELFELLGYTPDELRTHIERQFTRGMTWERFMAGEIHLDHVVPVKEFDLSCAESVVSCWSLPNLRPMWAADNLAKRDRRVSLL